MVLVVSKVVPGYPTWKESGCAQHCLVVLWVEDTSRPHTRIIHANIYYNNWLSTMETVWVSLSIYPAKPINIASCYSLWKSRVSFTYWFLACILMWNHIDTYELKACDVTFFLLKVKLRDHITCFIHFIRFRLLIKEIYKTLYKKQRHTFF